MSLLTLSIVLVAAGVVAFMVAIYYERRMHRHRHASVSYFAATFRLDGGWQRTDLFTAEGLQHQRSASRYGLIGVVLWIMGFVAYILSALSP